jgi:DNA (cytosine-5)-methyltransferase 1
VLTVGSLFAGIGGFDLGFERAGYDIRWQVEINAYCRAVLRKHWPDARRYGDVRRVGAHNLEPVDVICGGFPCQDISDAGARVGIDGERSGLWREMARVCRELRPNYLVVENVAALLNRGMGIVLGDLAAIGYDAEWECLPAFAFGAPHRRDRVFLVAHAQRRRLQGGIFQRTEPPAEFLAARHRGRFGHEHGAAWHPEPNVDLLADGVPRKLVADITHACGNAIVPQIATWIAERIKEAEAMRAEPINLHEWTSCEAHGHLFEDGRCRDCGEHAA